MEHFDPLDFQILKRLRSNSKAQLKEMAKELEIHPNTIIKRIKRLEDCGTICRYCTEIDYEKLGYVLQAIITIKTRNSAGLGRDEFIDCMMKAPNVEAVYAVTGEGDLIAIVRARDRQELIEILKKIRDCDCVSGTMSQQILATYKSSEDFNPLEK